MSPQKKKLEAALDNLFSSPQSKARTANAGAPEEAPAPKTRKSKATAPKPEAHSASSDPTDEVKSQAEPTAGQPAPANSLPEPVVEPVGIMQESTPAPVAAAAVTTAVEAPIVVAAAPVAIDPPATTVVPEPAVAQAPVAVAAPVVESAPVLVVAPVAEPLPVLTAPVDVKGESGKAAPAPDKDSTPKLNGYPSSNGIINANSFADLQMVVFTLDSQSYGVEITYVDSIIKIQAITPIPHSRSEIKGVTNLRGRVLPVVDLRTRFGLPEIDNTRNSRIIVIHIHKTEVGMLVDAVSEVMTLPATDVEPAPSIATSIDSDYVTGVAKVGDRLVIMLDVAKILAIQDEEK